MSPPLVHARGGGGWGRELGAGLLIGYFHYLPFPTKKIILCFSYYLSHSYVCRTPAFVASGVRRSCVGPSCVGDSCVLDSCV